MTYQTHHAPHMGETAWMAVDMEAAIKLLEGYDLSEEEKNDIEHLMMGYCRLLDEADLIGYGRTEDDAIEDLKIQRDI